MVRYLESISTYTPQKQTQTCAEDMHDWLSLSSQISENDMPYGGDAGIRWDNVKRELILMSACTRRLVRRVMIRSRSMRSKKAEHIQQDGARVLTHPPSHWPLK